MQAGLVMDSFGERAVPVAAASSCVEVSEVSKIYRNGTPDAV